MLAGRVKCFVLSPSGGEKIVRLADPGSFFGEEAARGALLGELTELIGENGAAAVQATLSSAQSSDGTLLSLLIGVAAYTILGGMLSVLITDFLQFGIAMTGSVAAAASWGRGRPSASWW